MGAAGAVAAGVDSLGGAVGAVGAAGAGAEVSLVGAVAGVETGAVGAGGVEAVGAAGLVAFGADFFGFSGLAGEAFSPVPSVVVFASSITSILTSVSCFTWSLETVGACGAVATSDDGNVLAVTIASVLGAGLPQDTIMVRIESRNK